MRRFLLHLQKSEEGILERKTLPGHVTASGFVLSSDFKKVLLIKHKALGKLIQPGGHVDHDDKTLIDAALREVSEETGVVNLIHVSSIRGSNIPFNIDIHEIPANEKKSEAAHLHYDFQYLFCATGMGDFRESISEIDSAHWVDLEVFSLMNEFRAIAGKIKTAIIENRDSVYFKTLERYFFPKQTSINFVVVAHIVSDVPVFLESLRRIGTVSAVIPKRSSINKQVLEQLREAGYPIFDFGRQNIQEEHFLEKIFNDDKPYIVLDVGGYFANSHLFTVAGKKIIGIVEDTENGFQKYETVIKHEGFPYSVFSVARSPLKKNEDDLVGYSVGYYTEFILRREHLLPRYSRCAIVGYGKVGRGIAKYLFMQGIKPAIFDINPVRMVQAFKDGCTPQSRDDLLSEADVIFCATGSKSITAADFPKLKTGCFIASVTSSDDEFNLQKSSHGYREEEIDQFVTKMIGERNYFYLLNNGNAVNFIVPGDRAGNFIRLVQGELIACVGRLASGFARTGIHELSEKDHMHIASVFLSKYGDVSISEQGTVF